MMIQIQRPVGHERADQTKYDTQLVDPRQTERWHNGVSDLGPGAVPVLPSALACWSSAALGDGQGLSTSWL